MDEKLVVCIERLSIIFGSVLAGIGAFIKLVVPVLRDKKKKPAVSKTRGKKKES